MPTKQAAVGRPRNTEADRAILDAALSLLIDRGIEATSIEQVARLAGVTRATVYRRYADKTRLLIAALETAYGSPPATPTIRDVDELIYGWSAVIAEPRIRRLLRRLYGVSELDPELARAYQDMLGRGRDDARRAVLERAQERGQLPADADIDVVLDLMTGAVWQHISSRPDSDTLGDAIEYLRAALHHLGYRVDARR